MGPGVIHSLEAGSAAVSRGIIAWRPQPEPKVETLPAAFFNHHYPGSKMMFVVFSNRDEVIVTTGRKEAKAIQDFFTDGGRSLDDYDRETFKDNGVSFMAAIIAGT